MKKILSAIISVLTVFSLLSFSACSEKTDEPTVTEESDILSESSAADSDTVTETDSTASVTAAEGEEVTLSGTVGEPTEKTTDSVTGKTQTSEKTDTSSTAESSIKTNSSIPAVTFTVAAIEAKPGETVTAVIHMSNAPYFACLSANVEYASDTLTYKKSTELKDSTYHSEIFEKEDELVYYSYVAETLNVADEDLLKIIFTVDENAVSGTKTEITLNIDELCLGTSADGAEIYDVSESYEPLTVTVNIL